MRIVLNGVPRELDGEATIADLVEAEALGNRRIAVEVNGAIVPKSQHAGTRLADGDRVEIVHALGGG
jgi:sulfur carrier protein